MGNLAKVFYTITIELKNEILCSSEKTGGELLIKKKFRGNIKGISTIIATIIIVSISIVMAIGVAYWAMGIGNSFTKFEKVEWISIYADPPTAGSFRIYVSLKNTGSAAATIDNIFIDSRPINSFPNVNQTNLINTTLNIGSPRSGSIYLPVVGGTWSSGNTVAVTISTAAGREYPNFVVLP